MIIRNITRHKDEIAILSSGKEITYRNLEQDVEYISQLLQGIGLLENEPIGVVFDNSYSFIIWLLACFKQKVPIALLPSYFKKSELYYHMSSLKIRYCVVQKEYIDIAVGDMDLHSQFNEYSIFKSHFDDFLVLNPGDLIIQFTTGSSADSKAIVRTEKSVEQEILSLYDYFHIESQKRPIFAPVVPLCHSYGLIGGLLFPLYFGYSVLLANPKFIKDAVFKISEHSATHLFATSYIYSKFNEILTKEAVNLTNLNKCFNAGMPMDIEIAKAFKELTQLTIFQNYGSTETGTMSIGKSDIVDSPDLGEFIGKAEVIVDQNKDSEKIIGELLLKNEIIDFEYIYPERLNSEKFTRGFYRTGDIVQVVDNKYYIMGRVDNFINVAGLKGYAKEITDTILEIKGVREAVVVGEENIISAFVVGNDLSVDAIKMHCKNKLSDYKVPRNVFFVDEIPKNNIGKILKKYLIKDYGV